jgi:Leucine-rich repeat (LRR) protein
VTIGGSVQLPGYHEMMISSTVLSEDNNYYCTTDDRAGDNSRRIINKAAAVGTQLRLQDRQVERLDDCLQQQLHRTSLTLFHTLTVLYIYDNQLESLEGVQQLVCLRELYAQNNRLNNVSALSGCRTLRKLYLNRNQIHRFDVHGLEGLEVLSLEAQRSNQPLQLPSDAFAAMKVSYYIYASTISHTSMLQNLNSLFLAKNTLAIGYGDCLAQLISLETLDLQHCQLRDWHELMQMLRGLKSVRFIRLKGNPVVNAKYRDSLLLLSRSLSEIDGRPVLFSERRAVEHMASVRRLQSQ